MKKEINREELRDIVEAGMHNLFGDIFAAGYNAELMAGDEMALQGIQENLLNLIESAIKSNSDEKEL